jgi:hypothetical protein
VKLDILSAVQDPNLFLPYVAGEPDGDLATWANWLAFLRTLYGLPLPDDDRETVKRCTGRVPDLLPSGGFNEALLLCGRRSGKSKIIALVGAAEAVLSGKEAGLSRGEIGMVAVLSPTRFQSRIIHEYMKGVFDSTPLLQREVEEEKRDGFVLKNGVEVSIITGDPRTCRGFSLLACIVDEIAFFGLSEESKVRSDTELVRALRPSLASTGGRLLCVGTPYAAKGYAYQTWKRGWGTDDCDLLVWNAASLLMNPTLSEAVVRRAVEEDPTAANVEYCTAPGLFREDVETFISRAAVEALVVPGRKELPPHRDCRPAAFADVSGGRHDDAALAIGHKEGAVIVLDLLERYKAPHDPHQVVADMADTLKRYGIDRATGDAYAAEWTRTTFASHGIDYRRSTTSVWKEGSQVKNKVAKPKSVLYAELLPRLTSGEVELLDDEMLITQLSSLQRRTRSGARDSIDHPPGGKDDLANAVAGVCDAVSQRRIKAGIVGDDPDERPDEQPLDRATRRARRREDSIHRRHDKIAAYPFTEEQEGLLRALDEAGYTGGDRWPSRRRFF